MAKLLIEAGADVKAGGEDCPTALELAEEANSKDVIELLKVAGAKEEAISEALERLLNALITPAENNDVAETQRLIAAGADVNAKGHDGKTALMYAAQNNAADVAKALIAAGADVNAKDIGNETALIWAAGNNATDAAKVLIEAGADVNAKDEFNNTALMIAEEANSKDVIELLKAAGAKE